GVGDIANLSVNMTGALNVNLPAGGQTVGALNLGTTGSAFATDIGNANSSGGALSLDNTGGVNNSDGNANPSITSGGIAGATNVISAPVVLSGATTTELTTASSNPLLLSGGITASGAARTFNNLSAQTLTISGPIYLSEVGASAARGLTLNSASAP